MNRLGSTNEDLVQLKKIQRPLAAVTSLTILRNQANQITSKLQVLKRRSDSGQETAGRIWASLVDGITAVIPAEFFNGNDRNYFWEKDEELTTSEQAFKKLLDQACLKKNGSAVDGHCNENNQISTLVPEAYSVELLDFGKLFPPELPQSLVGQPCDEERIKEDTEIEDKEVDTVSDNLVVHLIVMIKVAVARTELNYWEWKEGDTELKDEVWVFNKSLKTALKLFLQILNSPEVNGFIDAIENASEIGTPENILDIMKNSTSAVGSAMSASEAISFFDYDNNNDDESGSDESYYDDEDVEEEELDSSFSEAESDEENTIVVYESKKDDKKLSSSPGATQECSTLKSDDALTGAEKTTRPPSNMYAAGKLITTVNSCRYEQCNHAGYPFPISHYRDWKFDGFRCVCGQKFRFLNAMDRHIFMQQELRLMKCDKCAYKVNRKCCLDKHKRISHEKPQLLKACHRFYQCMFGCDLILNSKRELHMHQTRTDRQCAFLNASKLSMKFLPSTPLPFVTVLKGTLARANIPLTVDNLDKVLTAAEKDAARMKKARKERIKMASKVQEDVVSKSEGKNEKLSD